MCLGDVILQRAAIDYMGQIHFPEFNGRSSGEENLRILWNPKFSTVLTRAYRWSVLCAT